jgi:outer membrane protein
MLKLEKKQVKIISIAIALVFIGSVVAIALTQTGTGIASAASSVNVGVVDREQVLSQHPEGENVNSQMNAAIAEIQKDFEEKSQGMTDQEKQDYYRQCQQRLAQKQQELAEPILKSVDDTIKKVADSKGLSVVIEKAAVVYGGTDITQDVISKLGKK